MAYKKRFDTSSAYGQLIILVFLPICVLAAVGGILVFHETMRASDSEQEVLAEAVLIRYTPVIAELIPELLEQERQQVGSSAERTQQAAMTTLEGIQDKLGRMQSEQHVQRIAIINEGNQVLATVGYGLNEEWPLISDSASFLSQRPTPVGTAYGSVLGEFEGQTLWLLVDMDNEPLYIARYRIAMALVITGLFTILILLLSLNIYSKRWIAPIYELRLQLQRTHVDNLYQPVPVESDGELNLLQQDLVRTLRRLHRSFQELKDHAEQTEDDLRLAFDEMEMQNISIRNARDAAISTSQAKSAFLANISHELRTPLNSIDGFINLLARHGELNPEQDLYVQTIRKSSAHLLALVNDVLDFSKIEAGKLVLDRHEFDLYDTIYDVVDMLSPVSAEKGLRMAVLFYNDVPMRINGDALRLKQVLTNIVGNAIKFTDSGDVVVRVSLDDHRDNYLMISVQDSGKGISLADQKMLFQSFSQGDPSITRQYGGTGLGLVISKQLTRLMGGDIGFHDNAQENIANQGATFWFRMPAHVDVLEAATGQTIELPVLAPLASETDEFNVLVWINHTASIQVLKASLQYLPIKLTQANSLPGVLESLKEHGNYWDWVIVDDDTQDDMMALLKQIRLHYQGKLAVFGYQVAADQALLNRYHANILYEPLDKRQLYAMLDTQSRSTPQSLQEPRWKGVTVLAVDDHLPNLLVLDALLSELGIQVVTASSGFDAIEIISKQQTKNIKTAKSDKQSLSNKTQLSKAETRDEINKKTNSAFYHEDTSADDKAATQDKDNIDLIFMDIQMPRMSGHEAAKQIRNIENADSRIPIIALTAHGLADERDKLIASGINDYVGKPISQPQLLQVLQKWLGRKSTTPQLTALPDTDLQSFGLQHPDLQSDNLQDANVQGANVKDTDSSEAELTAIDSLRGYSINDNDLSNDLLSNKVNNKESQASSDMSSDDSTATYPIIRGDGVDRNSTSVSSEPKITRPLSLKKIRDDYLRDSQPREGYRRDTARDIQPRYESLRLQKQGQSPLLQSPTKSIDSSQDKRPQDQSFHDRTAHDNTTLHEQINNDLSNNNISKSDTSNILDWQDALTRSANKPELAAKLIIMMIDTINDEKQALIQAWESHDRNMLAQIAHRILGGSRYTGVPQLRQASQDLEDKCLLNVQHTTPVQFAMIEPYYEVLLTALDNLQKVDLSSYPQLNYHRLSENDMTWKMI
ncbi:MULTISPECIES: ATP-binding protein [unclassified Psychrobacter]|uniref:hybrid sensor histidine kinase/response regulator n=2 Tax=unclassified Psychrobacter TaxID=196806 RepID=UPI00086DCDAB|nr:MULTISPECIES: ATP-binding protein [unclassified Psychrobacter]MBA6243368.1 response regulator [Psychrobacter sp. Urea-trap-18]MBA6286971.1 response regulator [Psychrobacter sp. Urea-trap-16]MBA6318020.1 response regulator [Psychrobacter sp. Urea-trap-20]MBA6333518.1 response regulator [Psychrobacter sp. Urea-trap-19]OEH68284.1 MAG: hybrid sensor histidine kinase/response regulator [Psychrobacter sp. B29-1]|tara:strand:+ start:108340 stop:111969 length:3630 start_codon:yes stop_codon:yes gene_type:complete